MRQVLFLLAALSVMLTPSGPVAWASTTTQGHADTRQKINLAGRQRMLSQRMTASACLVMMGILPENRRQVAEAARQEFALNLVGLVQGDLARGLTPEENRQVIAAFDAVDATWHVVNAAIQQIIHKDLHSIPVTQLMTLNMALLSQSDDAVTTLVETYGTGSSESGPAKTINLAGRQRMLTQKMIKEACFIFADLNAVENRQALSATTRLFDETLEQLRNGDATANVIPPISTAQEAQFQTVQTLWDEMRASFEAIEPNGPESKARLEALVAKTDRLLRESNAAVQLYVTPAS